MAGAISALCSLIYPKTFEYAKSAEDTITEASKRKNSSTPLVFPLGGLMILEVLYSVIDSILPFVIWFIRREEFSVPCSGLIDRHFMGYVFFPIAAVVLFILGVILSKRIDSMQKRILYCAAVILFNSFYVCLMINFSHVM